MCVTIHSRQYKGAARRRKWRRPATDGVPMRSEPPRRRAGSTSPDASPNPMRTAPGRSHQPCSASTSPSSRKRARLAVGSASGLLAAGRELQQRSRLGGRRARLRAGAEQVARLQVAAVDRVVRDQLRDASSTHARKLLRASSCGARPARASRRSRASPRPRCRTRPSARSPGASRYGSGGGSSAGRVQRHAKRLQRLERDDPRRDRGREVLREERPERLVLPRLDVARGPVVQQARAPNTWSSRLGDRRCARRARCPGRRRRRARARSRAAASGRTTGTCALGGMRLAAGRRNGVPRHDDRRRAPVIADRHPLVVRQQRLVGAEHARRRWSRDGSTRRSPCSRRSSPAARARRRPAATRQAAHALARRRVGAQQARHRAPHARPGVRPGGHERVERGRRAQRERARRRRRRRGRCARAPRGRAPGRRWRRAAPRLRPSRAAAPRRTAGSGSGSRSRRRSPSRRTIARPGRASRSAWHRRRVPFTAGR